MVIPSDEIQTLAERLKSAPRGAAVGFTSKELELICQFSETFWDEVDPRRKKLREARRAKYGGNSEPIYI
jgi:hypothetical protein